MRIDSAVSPNHAASDEPHEATIAVKRIWLTSWAYELLPYFYIIAGVAAIVSAIYVNHWYWAVPFYLIFGGMCVHGGLIVRRLRHQHRQHKLKK